MNPRRTGLRNTLLVARRQVGAIREDRYVIFLLGLVIALGVVAVLGARHHAANEAEQRARYQAMVERQWAEQPDRRTTGGLNPGRESPNYLQGCTICVPCRWTGHYWTVPRKRENRT